MVAYGEGLPSDGSAERTNFARQEKHVGKGKRLSAQPRMEYKPENPRLSPISSMPFHLLDEFDNREGHL